MSKCSRYANIHYLSIPIAELSDNLDAFVFQLVLSIDPEIKSSRLDDFWKQISR